MAYAGSLLPVTLPSNPIRFFLSSIPTPVPLSGTPSFPQSAYSTSITKFQSELLLIDLLFSSLDRVTIDSCSRFWFLSIRFLLDKLPIRPTRSPLLLPPSESSAIQSFTALPPSMYYYDKDPQQFSLLPFLANLLFPLASLETDHTLDGDPPPILPNPPDPHSTSQKNHLATSTEVELARSKQAVQLTPCHGKEQQNTTCSQQQTGHQRQQSTQNREHGLRQSQAQAIPNRNAAEGVQIVPHLTDESLTLAAKNKEFAVRTTPHDAHLQPRPYNPDQASAPASRAPRKP